ncbi:SpoIIE family protein phosphatase [Actinokineospora sp. NBRC 105648]|uniref:SpoIIE family protein phosphatase n=1 Tax=Actinokineospora sp. NBRC 105648 TaxID=3032206 RepID=UPI002557A95E|nr:SpoIIE family protein phosphatase [Actinokineospora sp. NBRC 105648]
MPEHDDETGTAEAVVAAFEATPVALLGLVGPTHTVVAVNAAMRAMLGRDGLVGHPLREVVPDADGQQLFEVIDEVYATGRPSTSVEWRVQLDRDGERHELYVDAVVIPRHDAEGRVTGVLGYAMDATERVHARQAAQRRADDAERRYAQARDVISSLQRELLPTALPVLPGVQVAASYLLADTDTAAGGDWFDAIALPGDRVALVVGDVVGHGVAASAVMGQLRAVLHDRIAGGEALGSAFAALDRMAGRLPGARAATVCAAVLDPATGHLSYCTAGHPPPLLVSVDGATRYLPTTGSGPLGSGTGFTLAEDRLAEGELVVLYSDGIIERPGRDHARGAAELARVVGDVSADRAMRVPGASRVEQVCTQTLELLVRATGHTDDITLLAARRVRPPAALSLDLPAEATSVGVVRAAVAAWLADLDVDRQDVLALQHGLAELVTNVVDHAYPAVPGAVRVAVTLAGAGRVEAAVSDDGRWRAPTSTPGRGLGLVMASSFADHLRIEHDDHGTTATVSRGFSHPARLLTAAEITPGLPTARHRDPSLLLVLDQPSARGLRAGLDGPVDASTARQLDDDLRHRTRGGAVSVTLDLSGVTHLASAGVAALIEARDRAEENDTELVLFAPTGGPAQQVLSLVALGHVTRDPDTPGG